MAANITNIPADVMGIIYSNLNDEGDPLGTIENRENFAKSCQGFQYAAERALSNGRVADHKPLINDAEILDRDQKKLKCLNKKISCYLCALEISGCSIIGGVALVASSCGCCCCTVSALATKVMCITGGSLGGAGFLSGLITWSIGHKSESLNEIVRSVYEDETSSLTSEVVSRRERLNVRINGERPEMVSMSDV